MKSKKGIIILSTVVLACAVGFIVSLLVPLGKLGTDLAHRCGAYPPGMKFNLLNAIPLAVGNTLIISLIVSFVGVAMARAKMPAEAIAHMNSGRFPPATLGLNAESSSGAVMLRPVHVKRESGLEVLRTIATVTEPLFPK